MVGPVDCEVVVKDDRWVVTPESEWRSYTPFAREVHKGQRRPGNPYADHLAEVAGIAAAVTNDICEMLRSGGWHVVAVKFALIRPGAERGLPTDGSAFPVALCRKDGRKPVESTYHDR